MESGATPRLVPAADSSPADERELLSTSELIALAEREPLRAAERIMAHLRSPAGCPWDREQTMESIRRHTLEEVYEVFEAIERRAWPELQDELGDLLLQILFYAQIASEAGQFAFDDVARSLCAKLIRRHPHIFAEVKVGSSAEVKRNWEEIKRSERQGHGGEALPPPLLAGISRAMPALSEARKLGSAASRVGFDWPDSAGVLAKVREELLELESAIGARQGVNGDQPGSAATISTAIEEEFGDVLFSMSSLARHLGLDAEMALRGANAKFRRRFGAVEIAARERGGSVEACTPEQMDELWTEAKLRETGVHER